MTKQLEDFVFLGFNKQVIALDRYTGEKMWEWKSPKGSGYPALLLDGDRIIVSVQGYTYCLEPLTGSEVWSNELKGHGTGTPSVVSVRGCSSQSSAAHHVVQQAAAAAASTGSGYST